MTEQLDLFTCSYIEAALWSSTDNEEEPLAANYDINDIEPATLAEMAKDCRQFQAKHADLIGDELEQAGHDFWLTRNRHGAGFWDGDWPEPAATILTESANAWGEVDLYVPDTGKVAIE